MEPKRTLHSKGHLKAFYDPEKYMELGTCFILLRDGVHKIDGEK